MRHWLRSRSGWVHHGQVVTDLDLESTRDGGQYYRAQARPLSRDNGIVMLPI